MSFPATSDSRLSTASPTRNRSGGGPTPGRVNPRRHGVYEPADQGPDQGRSRARRAAEACEAGRHEVATMEYLVTMTTHVPEATPDELVDDVRGREAGRSRELAAQGHLLRLWRPPLRPGEWRTLGLFAAADDGQLEEVLASMPLRVWRTDEVTALSPHPNDPGLAAGALGSEFLTRFVIVVPEGTPAKVVEETEAQEAARAKELAGQGRLRRLWTLSGRGRALGLWQAAGSTEIQAILRSLPLDPWMTVQTTPLTPHPSDPAGRS
ncbi:MAG TPA: muconolactone Delta-isomerase family protein [Streptosporangiaceae bacterium]